MNISTIKRNVETIETSAQTTKASAGLKRIIAEHGSTVIADEQKLFSLIDQIECSEASKLRYKLVFSCVSIRNYFSGESNDIKMTQIDSMIRVITSSTGLSYLSAVETLSEILCAFGIDYTITYSPVLEGGKIVNQLHTVMPADVARKDMDRVKKDFSVYVANRGNFIERDESELLNAIKRLCEAGMPEAFYLLSKCYRYGYLNTSVNEEQAEELAKIAADAGCSEAASDLADLLYEKDDGVITTFDKALYYYTKPGSVPLNSTQQMRVKDIFMQRKENRVSLVFLVLSTILSIVFLAFFNKGIFSGSSRLIIGIIFAIIGIIYDVLVFGIYFKTSKFNNIRPFLIPQYLWWMIFILILELA